ncbi:uncharacterized protein G2W53_012841 [Senna tora]|uniref:Uncharacterized protein n=1 Tax=Senna tora TaxID=362788 RepID=A0A834WQV2_9FABA|nr:uncharacterized protein G2W53_012841 [Senna tora]
MEDDDDEGENEALMSDFIYFEGFQQDHNQATG